MILIGLYRQILAGPLALPRVFDLRCRQKLTCILALLVLVSHALLKVVVINVPASQVQHTVRRRHLANFWVSTVAVIELHVLMQQVERRV